MKKSLPNLVCVLIKPDAMDFIAEILSDITAANFVILKVASVSLTEEQLQEFLKKHKDAEWISTMISFMQGKEMKVLICQKENAVEKFRKIRGDKDPSKAEDRTLRRMYGVTMFFNGVHSSGSEEETKEEIAFFFPKFVLDE